MEQYIFEDYSEVKLIEKYMKLESIYRHCPLEYNENCELYAAKLYYSFYGRAKFIFTDDNDLFVLHDLQQLSRNVHSIKLESISDFEPFGNLISKLITHYNVTKYKMYIDFNKPIIAYSIPSSLKTLILPFNFNQELMCPVYDNSNDIPRFISVFPDYGLTSLDMGIEFNQQIPPNVLPKSLLTLKLSKNYNTELLTDSIPNSVTYLHFGNKYNHPLSNGIISNSIKTLILSNEFNHPIEYGQLSESITILIFGNRFNQDIQIGLLPTYLKKIKFGSDFNSVFEPSPFIDKIIFGNSFKIQNDQIFPTTLNSLQIENSYHYQLPNINKLKYSSNFNTNYQIIDLPIDYYPYDSLISLHLDQLSKKQLESGFLTNFRQLTHLKFGNSFNISINEYCLPNKTLKSLEFGSHFDHPLKLKRMKKLIYLKLGEFYTHFNDIIYPISIKAITYNGFINIKSNSLPSTIEYFELSNLHTQTISNDILPKQLSVFIHSGEPVIDMDNFTINNIKIFYLNRNNKSLLINNLLFVNYYYNIIQVFKSSQNKIIKRYLDLK